MQDKEVIFGAPGCGKTTYLLNILEKELKEHNSDRIAFVSFTKKGASEGLTRAMEKFDYEESDLPHFRTLHSMCFRALGMKKADMLSKNDYRIFSKAMNMNFVGYYTEEFFHNDDKFLYMYFLKLNNYEMYKKIRDATNIDVNMLKHVALNYTNYKKKFFKTDFTDMLTMAVDQKIKLDVDIAIIDEAQDLTTLQWKVCETLFSGAKKVYIAGDDDQAIYEWSGADITYFLGIKGKRTILDKSWRLKSELLAFAKSISSEISSRVEKDFQPYEEGGEIEYYNTFEGFKFNPDESYYCLSRNNYFLKRYTTELRKQVKVYKHKGKLSVDPKVVEAINNYKDYKADTLAPKERYNVERFLRRDIKSIDKLSWFEVFNIDTDESFYYRKLIQNKVDINDTNVTVSTIHGVKGGEADNVVLFMDVTKAVYQQLYSLSDSELRCLYVACTRAKNKLHIVHASSKYSYSTILSDITGVDNEL